MPDKTPCPKCRESGKDKSGNNLIHFNNGSKHCFACHYHIMGTVEEQKYDEDVILLSGEYRNLPHRGISKAVCEFFDYEVGEVSGKTVEIANSYKNGEITGQKIRLENKEFFVLGKLTGLFGQQRFAPNKNVFITITEGEIDQLSLAESIGTRFPIVSVLNGASDTKSIKDNIEYLKGFKHIVLCFDNDKAGQEGAKKIAALFDPGFCKIAKLPLNDVNDMLKAGRGKELTSCLFNAQAIRNESIIQISDITLDDIRNYAKASEGINICFPILNNYIGGLRHQSLYTIVAKAKSGKTTVTKEIVYDLIENTDHKVGALYLEGDDIGEPLSFIAMQENKPAWKFQEDLANDDAYCVEIAEKVKAYESKGLYTYKHQGIIDIDSVYSAIQYMVKCLECKIIILDNLSISIAGTDLSTNERKLIDNTVYKLVQFINQTGCIIVVIVHVNQEGEGSSKVDVSNIFGSGAFGKFSSAIISIDNVKGSVDPLVQLSVLGNRVKGLKGGTDLLKYNQDTGRLRVCPPGVFMEVGSSQMEYLVI